MVTYINGKLEGYQKPPSQAGFSPTIYIKQFKARIRTKDDFYRFERNNPKYLTKLPSSVVKAIRRHGLKVTGLQAQIGQLQQRHGVKVITEHGPRELWVAVARLIDGLPKAKAIPLHLVAQRLSDIKKRYEFYPPGFLKKGGLKRIYLLGTQVKVKAGASYGYKIGGEAHVTGSVLLYPDPTAYDGRFDHEVYHLHDHKDGGYSNENHQFGLKVRGKGYQKHYGKSGLEAFRSGQIGTNAPKGFATSYGKLGGIDEDQAETARLLLLSPQSYKQLMARAVKEPALMRAIQKVKADYKRWSNGRMDEKFWSDFAAGSRIDQQYWQTRTKPKQTKQSSVTRFLLQISQRTGITAP